MKYRPTKFDCRRRANGICAPIARSALLQWVVIITTEEGADLGQEKQSPVYVQ